MLNINIIRTIKYGLVGLVLWSATLAVSWSGSETVLGLPKVEVLYTDPEKALKDGKPVRIEREAQYVEQWGVWLLAEHQFFYEGQNIKVSLRNEDGKVIVAYPPMIGPFIISEDEKRILDCGICSHYDVESAVLFDSTGKELLKIPKVIYTRDCGRTDDGRLFWLHYNAVEKGSPVNILRFIDRDGNIVYEVKRFDAGEVSFTYNSRPYCIDFPAPDYPG